ncbi:MAG: NACHT domain-containing protein, partial [Proteobacteria bacterium]|nr:NACHT domain-containing protein [Pseudomonadota bacterium]
MAEELCKILMEESSSSDEDQILESKHMKTSAAIIAQYGDHLRSIYQTELSYSLEISDFIPCQTRTVFNLALIGHERIQYGTEIMKRMQEILSSEIEEKKEVKLENIFKSGQHGGRQFILLEGAAGAGKSALVCFICQKWGAGELFQEFQFVIFIQLNDLHIQSAQSLADIFHSGSRFDTDKVVSSLQSTQGRGVLFIMDGWDEYPLQLEESSLIEKLIRSPGEFSMQLSTVVITSRPVASGKLQRYCSSRLEIIGYKQEELEGFFREALQDNPQKIAKLNEFLETMPLIKKSCRLPLNAAIVAHTFKCSDGSLPS